MQVLYMYHNMMQCQEQFSSTANKPVIDEFCRLHPDVQPKRVRAFIDLAVERLHGGGAYILTTKELASAESNGRKAFNRCSCIKGTTGERV